MQPFSYKGLNVMTSILDTTSDFIAVSYAGKRRKS